MKYIVLVIMLMAAVCWGQYAKPGTGGSADSATVHSWTFVLASELGPFIDTTSTHIPVADSALKAVADGAGNAITSTYETITNVAKIGDDTSNFKTAYGWGNHASGGYESVTNVAKIGDDTTNFKTAYTHSQDGSNAHGDYIDSAAVHDSLDILRGDAADTTYKIVNDSMATIINPTNDPDSGDVLYAIITTGNDTSYEWHSLAWGGGAGDDDSLSGAQMPCDLDMNQNDINNSNTIEVEDSLQLAGTWISGIYKIYGVKTVGYVVTYDTSAVGADSAYWAAQTGGGGSGFIQIQVDDAGSDSAETIDFGAGFDVSIGSGEADVTLDLTEKKVNLTNEVTGVLPDSNISGVLTLDTLKMNSESITQIYEIKGTPADGDVPIIDTDPNPDVVSWGAQTGSGGGTSDTLIINEGTTEYSTISNRLKIKEGTGLDITREDSTNFDVLRFAVSLGTNINLTNEVTGLLPDSNIASATNWGTAYTHSQDGSNAHGDYIDSAAVHDSLDILRANAADSARNIVDDSLANYLPLAGGTMTGTLVGADRITAETLIVVTAYQGIIHAESLLVKKSYVDANDTIADNGVVAAKIASDAVGDDEIDYANVTLADFDYQTAWRVFYSNTDGDVTELALGADGTYLKSNGASAAPTFAVPSGTGDMLASAFDDSLNNAHTITGLWAFGDGLSADSILAIVNAYHYEAHTDSAYMSKKYIDAGDSAFNNFSELGGTVGDAQIAASAVDGGTTGEIEDQTITKADLDTTGSNFVFDDAYNYTSAVPDSVLITKKYADDNDANGETAYGWGNHASANYLDEDAGSVDSAAWNDAYVWADTAQDSVRAWDNRGYPQATTSALGIASFATANFGVTTGAVTIKSGGVTATEIGTDGVSADELNATGVEAELEAVLDLESLQGAVTDGQVPDSLKITLADGSIKGNKIDTSGSNFVFDDAYHITSAAADSEYSTFGYVKGMIGDSLGEYSTTSEVRDIVGDSLGEYSTTAEVRDIVGDSLGEYSTTAEVQALIGAHHWIVNVGSPSLQFDIDSLWSIDPRTDAALTVTRIDVTCDANPATELDFDLMFANDFINMASETVIDELNTTDGVATITTGFDDATVPANKCIYLRFNVAPDANITQVIVKVTWDYD